MMSEVQERADVRNFLQELGVKTNLVVISDSTGAFGVAEKAGALHTKHVELRYYLKALVARGDLKLEKVGTAHNPADVLTKTPTAKMLENMERVMPCWTFAQDEEEKE